MLTKEQLLQKGISPAVADEILAAANNQEDSSLLALQKALKGDDMDSLFKAGEGNGGQDPDDNGDDDDDYDEEYMKKYMKKFMVANKSACTKAAKEVGLFGDEMKKAIDGIDMNADGAIIEMADLSDYLDAQVKFNSKLTKAFDTLLERVEIIAEQNAAGYSLLHKASTLQADMAEGMGSFLNSPAGRKGVTTVDMGKAKGVVTQNAANTNAIYTVLFKAMQSGDEKADMVLSAFESAGKNINKLDKGKQAFIAQLMAKEAK